MSDWQEVAAMVQHVEDSVDNLFENAFAEYPFVICDKDGVVDRVATVKDAEEYVASMPTENLTFYDSREDAAATREP